MQLNANRKRGGGGALPLFQWMLRDGRQAALSVLTGGSLRNGRRLWPQRRAQMHPTIRNFRRQSANGPLWPAVTFLLSVERCNFIGNPDVAIVVHVPHICTHPFYFLHITS